MPIHKGKDINGYYYQWGNHGKRYYYNINSELSRKRAHKKAIIQKIAAIYHGYKEK